MNFLKRFLSWLAATKQWNKYDYVSPKYFNQMRRW